MKKITKALFPVAGIGTRMLPLTKSISKEMLPIFNRPVLDLLVEECINAGIEEIIFVISKGKNEIMDYFCSFPELEKKLQKKTNNGDKDSEIRLKQITKFNKIKFSTVRQYEQLGDGHAILQAKHLLKNEPFIIVFGDDLTFSNNTSKESKKSSITQLLEAYEKTQSSIIGVRSVPMKNISSYGVVDINKSTNKVNLIKNLVEKPNKKNAPSNQAIIGKYICTHDIWYGLENATSSIDGEIRLIDGFSKLLEDNIKIFSCSIEGDRFDTGNINELLFANIYFALKSKKISKDDILNIMNKID